MIELALMQIFCKFFEYIYIAPINLINAILLQIYPRESIDRFLFYMLIYKEVKVGLFNVKFMKFYNTSYFFLLF
jgi:hypothetical protein